MRKKRNRLLGLALLLSIFSCCSSVFAQTSKITVTGNVLDSTNANLIGATVSATGKTVANTTTDINGKFVIDVEPGTLLSFSMVGFVSQTVTVTANTKTLLIKLLPTKSDLDQVVVTAFGKKQLKEAVIGSVSTIEPAKLLSPASNLTNMLVGQVAGIIGFQQSGQPGLDNSSFFVRGATSFGYRQEPIILIDNIELTKDDLARLQVNDIASFTILKDASSTALYGARGANGVILVTTKRGIEGRAQINIQIDNVVSEATRMIELADPITYMKTYNQAGNARPATAGIDFFSADKIYNTQQTIDNAPGSNRFVYPAVDWLDLLFKKRTNNFKGTASVRGGGSTARYYVSGTYNVDNGNMNRSPLNNFNNNVAFKTYQIRGNTDMNLTKTTVLSVNLWGNFNEYTGPITGNASFATDLYAQATHTSPVMFAPYYKPDSANLLTQHILFGNGVAGAAGGTNGALPYYNPYAAMLMGFKTFSTSTMQATLNLSQKLDFITPGLSFTGFFTANRYSYFDYQMAYNPFYYTIPLPGGYNRGTNTYTLNWLNNSPGQATEYLSYTPGVKNATATVHFQGRINYNRSFGDHKVDVDLVGIRMQTINSNGVDPATQRPSLPYALPYRNLNFAGSINYTYKGRYIFQHGFAYNGTERFDKSNRFGYFPTGGVAWVVSKENFWKEHLLHIINSFKLSAAIGASGNDQIGSQRFFYLSNVNLQGGAGAMFGTDNTTGLPGVSIINYPNPNITWERSLSKNFRADISVAHALDLTIEYWTMKKKNILLNRLVPPSTGLEANIPANLGSSKGHGWDINANYTKQFNKDLSVQAMANFTYSQSHYTSYEEPNYPASEAYRYVNGSILGQPFGYIAERLFVDDKEVTSSPQQTFGNGNVLGGDIKYRDLNKDGKIDAADMAPIGFPVTPQIAYGFGVTVVYKAFDMGVRFQGSARTSFFIDPRAVSPFTVPTNPGNTLTGQTGLLKAIANDHWSFDNQNLYALYPRMGTVSTLIENNVQPSTWWIRDGSYLRLRLLEIGYSMPNSLLKRLHLAKCRIYASGSNLVNFTNFKLWDVELGGNAFNYPLQRQYDLGLNIGL